MKTLQSSTKGLSGLKTMVSKLQDGSWMAVQLEQLSDAATVASFIKTFVGSDLTTVTVFVVKG